MNFCEAIAKMREGKVVVGKNTNLYRINADLFQYKHNDPQAHWYNIGNNPLICGEMTFEEAPENTYDFYEALRMVIADGKTMARENFVKYAAYHLTILNDKLTNGYGEDFYIEEDDKTARWVEVTK